MRPWEKLLHGDEESALAYYRDEYSQPPQSSVAKLWIGSEDFRHALFRHAGVEKGDKLLLVSEDNERCGLSQQARDILSEEYAHAQRDHDNVSDGGGFVSIDVMSIARSVTPSYWDIHTDACEPYEDGYFDAAISTTSHHMADHGKEMRALARVVRPGGRVVYADNGPNASLFEPAKENIHLEILAQEFITWMGVRFGYGETLDECYENVRKWGCRVSMEGLGEEAVKFLDDVKTFEWKGLWLVSGKIRGE